MRGEERRSHFDISHGLENMVLVVDSMEKFDTYTGSMKARDCGDWQRTKFWVHAFVCKHGSTCLGDLKRLPVTPFFTAHAWTVLLLKLRDENDGLLGLS